MSSLPDRSRRDDPSSNRARPPLVEVAARSHPVAGRAAAAGEALGAAREAATQRDPFAGIGSALIPRYLLGLGALCFEVSRNPRLLPLFVCIIARVPSTLLELVREQKRIAA